MIIFTCKTHCVVTNSEGPDGKRVDLLKILGDYAKFVTDILIHVSASMATERVCQGVLILEEARTCVSVTLDCNDRKIYAAFACKVGGT